MGEQEIEFPAAMAPLQIDQIAKNWVIKKYAIVVVGSNVPHGASFLFKFKGTFSVINDTLHFTGVGVKAIERVQTAFRATELP